MVKNEREYLQSRLEQELRMADASTCPFASRIHAEMAQLYRVRLEALPRPRPKLVRRIAA